MFMQIIRVSAIILMALFALTIAPATAQEVEGPVILTISDKVSNPNRGPVDPAVDQLFVYSEAELSETTQFDYASLQKLEWLKANADFPKNGDVQEFEGPLLADVLKAAGATGKMVTMTALDGYAIEVKMQELIDQGAVLALKRNGRPFAVGDYGPTQIVFPLTERADLKEMPDDNWIWSIYHIKVE